MLKKKIKITKVNQGRNKMKIPKKNNPNTDLEIK